MQTYDLLTSMNGGLRELATQRWGLPATTPRVLAAMIVRPRAALRLMRRGTDAGAGQLTRLMVEYGGRTVPRHRVLEDEAARLRGWFPLIESADGWSLPADLAMAGFGAARVQRLFASTLVATLDGPSLDALLSELGMPRFGSMASRASRASASIPGQAVDDQSVAAAQQTAELGAIDIERIASLAPVPGSCGTRWRLETTDGDTFEVAPRELAAACDLAFAPPEVEEPAEEPAVRAPRLRLPTFVPVGAIVTFSSARAADDALRLGDFRTVVLHRLDERRVATREDCDARSALLILARLGFAIDHDVADEVPT